MSRSRQRPSLQARRQKRALRRARPPQPRAAPAPASRAGLVAGAGALARAHLLPAARLLALGALAWLAMAAPSNDAHAQFAPARRQARPATPPIPANRTDPVAFTADEVQYDRDNALVTATGNVEAWQNDHILRADKITFDRNTNIAAASGNVVIIEPDGQTLFSDYAELTEGFREGILRGMRAILAENGRLVANGGRRVEGKINELSRAVYTTCNLCAADPEKPPLWQIRARSAVQDTENKRIEYRDAVLDVFGVPVAGFPYFFHADPSAKRASGFLIPSFGQSKHLGVFLTTPYYIVLDEQSDATLSPTFNSQNYFGMNSQYRRAFNDGRLVVDVGIGYDRGGLEGDVFANGRFNYDDNWRWGFDIQRATSAQFLRDYRINSRGDLLTSSAFVEGFGVGAWTRVDVSARQAVTTTIKQNRLPYALPRYQYSFFGEPDALGGRLRFDTVNFNIVRPVGTNTQRLGGTLAWERPFTGLVGERYKLTLQTVAAGYTASSLDQNPNYYTRTSTQVARIHPQVALEVRWPVARDAGAWGTQIIEPIAQVIAGPQGGGNRNQRIPNEDSLDFEFTDQNLFQLNKFPGIDRVEGGLRANLGLRGSWTIGGLGIEGLVGQSFRARKDDTFPVGSGLEGRKSDYVARATVTPATWLDVTARTRLDRNRFTPRFADLQATTGTANFRVGGGYIYSAVSPYYYYDQPTIPASYFQHRNEITVNASGRVGAYGFSGYHRRDLATGKPTSLGAQVSWENECVILEASLNRRYTSLLGDNGNTLVLFQVTLKTVGQFGYKAL